MAIFDLSMRDCACSLIHQEAVLAIAAGTHLGPYEVISPLGAGGMGEVYRACDSRLGREVASNVLPAACAADADRFRRFEQEARAAGMLNHPKILAHGRPQLDGEGEVEKVKGEDHNGK